MIAAAALALALAAGDPLADARAALAAGDAVSAERLALEAAVPPREAEALYLAGLARFRQGRAAEALDALDRAGPSADAPGPYQYNRGACLLDLGRAEEAEAAFVAAAEQDPALAPAARVNAGYAALDAGQPARARAHAARARELPSADAVALVEALEREIAAAEGERGAAAYAEGLAAFDAGRYEAARAAFLAAAEALPRDGKSRLMTGAAALRLGRREEGVADVRRALALGLEAGDARVAEAYLAEAGEPAAWVTSRLEAGWDTNATQAPGASDDRAGGYAAEVGSALATAALEAGFSRRAGRLRLEGAYALEQLAYAAAAARDRAVQQHAAVLAVERAVAPRLHLGASAEGLLAFTGLDGFRGLQAGAGLRAWTRVELGRAAWARLEAAAAPRRGLAEFGHLGGTRLEGGAALGGTWRSLALRGGWRFQREGLGVARTAVPAPAGPVCELGCTAERVTPFGYDGHLLWAAARAGAGRLTLDLAAGAEWRRYLEDDRLEVTPAGGAAFELAASRREDVRAFAAASLAWSATERLTLHARLERAWNDSSLAGGGGGGHHGMDRPPPLGDPSYRKAVLAAGASLAW